MRLGKRERKALEQRKALDRARRIKAGRVSSEGKYAGAGHMARICQEHMTQWGHYAPNHWEYDGKAARRINSTK